jgi:hypothetical protein
MRDFLDSGFSCSSLDLTFIASTQIETHSLQPWKSSMRTAFYAILAAAVARTCIAIPTARDTLEAREIADVKRVERKAIRRQIGAAASAFLANLTGEEDQRRPARSGSTTLQKVR